MTPVEIRREAVYCGWGGELKDGGPVFIYKYQYFCVLSCTLCRNRQEQRWGFRFEGRGSKWEPKDSGAIETSHEWVPYVWSQSYGSKELQLHQCSAESALNHHEADGETTSPLRPRWGGAVLKSELLSCKRIWHWMQFLWIWTASPQWDENIYWPH